MRSSVTYTKGRYCTPSCWLQSGRSQIGSRGNSVRTVATMIQRYVLLRVSGVTARGRGRGAECPPDTSHWEISADLLGKEREGKKRKWRSKSGKMEKKKSDNGEERWKIKDRRWKIENGRRKSVSSGKMTLPSLKNIPLKRLLRVLLL